MRPREPVLRTRVVQPVEHLEQTHSASRGVSRPSSFPAVPASSSGSTWRFAASRSCRGQRDASQARDRVVLHGIAGGREDLARLPVAVLRVVPPAERQQGITELEARKPLPHARAARPRHVHGRAREVQRTGAVAQARCRRRQVAERTGFALAVAVLPIQVQARFEIHHALGEAAQLDEGGAAVAAPAATRAADRARPGRAASACSLNRRLATSSCCESSTMSNRLVRPISAVRNRSARASASVASASFIAPAKSFLMKSRRAVRKAAQICSSRSPLRSASSVARRTVASNCGSSVSDNQRARRRVAKARRWSSFASSASSSSLRIASRCSSSRDRRFSESSRAFHRRQQSARAGSLPSPWTSSRPRAACISTVSCA